MVNWLQQLKNSPGALRFLKFCMVGALNTGVDFLVYTLLTGPMGMDLYGSQVISYSAGMLNSYLFNRSWTFQSKKRFFSGELLGFVLVNSVVMGLSLAVLYVCNTFLGWYYLFSKVIAVGFTLTFGFVLNRLLVFGEKS